MKHMICYMLLCIATVPSVYACNSCGSSASGQSLGLLPGMQKHFVGVQYQQRMFNSEHPPLTENSFTEYSEELYGTIQLWGRYQVSKRIQLFAFVPYQLNDQYKNSTTVRNEGIGDISLLANIVAIRKAKAGISNILLVGGGIKVPTGAYSSAASADLNGLPNMQLGTGSWDFIANANYTVQNSFGGINAELSYTFTTISPDKYKYGNKLNSGITAFYKWQQGNVMLLPQAGLRFENVLHDYDNYDRKWLNEQTGGYQLYGNIGLQAYYKRTGLQLNYMLPVSQHYAGGYVNVSYSANAGLFILL